LLDRASTQRLETTVFSVTHRTHRVPQSKTNKCCRPTPATPKLDSRD